MKGRVGESAISGAATATRALLRCGAAACLALLLAGCGLTAVDFRLPRLTLPHRYPEPTPAPATTAAAIGVPANWWRLYGDPRLDALVAAGLQHNTDVRIAVAHIEEAEAVLREVSAASLLPQIDGTAAAARSRVSTRTGTLPASAPAVRNNFELAARTAFELDFWGRLRLSREAARSQYMATRYSRDVVALTLAASIARRYFDVRALDAQIAVSEETLQAAVDSLGIARSRAEAGVASDLDVNQSEANRAQIAAQIKDLRRQRAAATHQLGLLTGDLDLQLGATDGRVLPAPPLPPPGLPAQLLARRPDIRQAEAALEAEQAQIGVARAAQLPTITLTGALGTQSRELTSLFSAGAGIWSVGVNAIGPIVDWGRYAARTAQAEARARQAALAYEKAAEAAFREVADALSNVALAGDAETDLQQRVEYAAGTVRLATLRYDAGYSAYLEVLDAQRTLNEAQLALVRNRQAYLGYTVDLMNALGGGWAAY